MTCHVIVLGTTGMTYTFYKREHTGTKGRLKNKSKEKRTEKKERKACRVPPWQTKQNEPRFNTTTAVTINAYQVVNIKNGGK